MPPAPFSACRLVRSSTRKRSMSAGGRSLPAAFPALREALNYAICDIRDNHEAYTHHFIRR
jgi:hypothetical protein